MAMGNLLRELGEFVGAFDVGTNAEAGIFHTANGEVFIVMTKGDDVLYSVGFTKESLPLIKTVITCLHNNEPVTVVEPVTADEALKLLPILFANITEHA